MGKCCAVKNCSSGRRRDKGKNQPSRQSSFFKVPKDPHMLAQWSTALGEELDEKKYVCDLHFNSSDICKFEKVLLHDGTYFYSHRERCNLKTNAVPSLNPYIQSLPVDWGIVKKASNDISLISANSKIFGGNTELNTNNVSKQFELEDIRTSTLSFVTLTETLKTTALPLRWSWTSFPVLGTILLGYSNDDLTEYIFQITINEILKIKVKNSKTQKSHAVEERLSKMTDFWQLLKRMANMQFCAGTGLVDRKCSSNCTDILPLSETYKRFMAVHRCKACRAFRRSVLSNTRRKCRNNLQKQRLKEMAMENEEVSTIEEAKSVSDQHEGI